MTGDLNFKHFTINHKVGFLKICVNEFTGEEVEVHKNTIEVFLEPRY